MLEMFIIKHIEQSSLYTVLYCTYYGYLFIDYSCTVLLVLVAQWVAQPRILVRACALALVHPALLLALLQWTVGGCARRDRRLVACRPRCMYVVQGAGIAYPLQCTVDVYNVHVLQAQQIVYE